MDVCPELISIQKPEESASFITYLNARNKRQDTRNVELFKALIQGKEQRVKTEIGSNAYHALKKRLTDQLIEFQGAKLLSNELSSENQVIKLIVLARKLFSEQKIDAGFTLLKRAEKNALALDHFSLLNEIYHTMIEHSSKTQKFAQDELFAKLERNNRRFLAQERLNVLYASIQQQFNSESFKIMPTSFHEMYEEKRKLFGVDRDMTMDFKSLNQLCVFADLYGSQTKNYHKLDLFFEPLIGELETKAQHSEKMLDYHIELLYVMSNIYFRKRNAAKCLFYLDKMQVEMQRYNQKSFHRWQARYANMLALYHNFTGEQHYASALLEETLTAANLTEEERALLGLSLSMIHFQQERHTEAKRIINAFNKTDAWYLKHMGNEWLFNLKAIEVLLHFDLGNDLLAESRIQSFQRKYGVHFKQEKDKPIWPFIGLIKSVLFDHETLQSKAFAEKVETAIPWKGEEEDLFNACFYAWLKAKMLKRPIYEVTLEVLGM
jgi:hypothetical protein